MADGNCRRVLRTFVCIDQSFVDVYRYRSHPDDCALLPAAAEKILKIKCRALCRPLSILWLQKRATELHKHTGLDTTYYCGDGAADA